MYLFQERISLNLFEEVSELFISKLLRFRRASLVDMLDDGLIGSCLHVSFICSLHVSGHDLEINSLILINYG